MSLGPTRAVWIAFMLLNPIIVIEDLGLSPKAFGTIAALELFYAIPLIAWWGWGSDIKKWLLKEAA